MQPDAALYFIFYYIITSPSKYLKLLQHILSVSSWSDIQNIIELFQKCVSKKNPDSWLIGQEKKYFKI